MRIVLLDAFLADQGGRDPWPGLDRLGTVVRHDRTRPEQTAERLQGAQVAISNKVAIDRAVLAAGADVRHVAVTATGVNIVDLAACREAGVSVSNVPAYSTDSVAQQVFAYILDDACAVAAHSPRVHAGEWNRCEDFAFLARPTWELSGKRLAIIGHGTIGRAVATIATAFGMPVDVVQLPWRPPVPGRVPLAEALPRADIITLHCPLTEETEALVGGDFLDACRDDVLLINTGRGALIDEARLAVWLRAHPRARAALDVLASEPPPAGHPLLGHDQVRITPHTAWATIEARARLRAVVVDNVTACIEGRDANRVA